MVARAFSSRQSGITNLEVPSSAFLAISPCLNRHFRAVFLRFLFTCEHKSPTQAVSETNRYDLFRDSDKSWSNQIAMPPSFRRFSVLPFLSQGGIVERTRRP